MQKLCDNTAQHHLLDCVWLGKCRGCVALAGKAGKLKPLHEVDKCPYPDLARARFERNNREQKS